MKDSVIALGVVLVVAVGLVACDQQAGLHDDNLSCLAGDPPPCPSTPPSGDVSATQSADPSASNAGISESEAVEIARQAAPDAGDGDVRSAKAGPLADLFPAMEEFAWSRDLPPDRWVWSVLLVTEESTDENGAIVTIDYLDGTVYEVSTGFAD